MSTQEKKDYARGYAAGTKIRTATTAQHYRELQEVALRAERAEKASGIGHCEHCRHWNPPPNCSWGYCNVTRRMPGTPNGCWMQPNRGEGPISTSPRFGCVLFSAMPSTDPSAQPATGEGKTNDR